MKIAVVKPLTSSMLVNSTPDDIYSIRDVTESDYRDIIGKKKHFWFERCVKASFKNPAEYENFKIRFENFIMGYVNFYDDVNRSCVVDHTIYFKWQDFKPNSEETKVAVYLNPAPKRGEQYKLNEKGQRFKLVEGKATSTSATSATVDPPEPRSPPPPGTRPPGSSGLT